MLLAVLFQGSLPCGAFVIDVAATLVDGVVHVLDADGAVSAVVGGWGTVGRGDGRDGVERFRLNAQLGLDAVPA